MNTDHNELLKESIKASNRTTHAVRAFVRFFLIQLTASTVALAIYLYSTTNPFDSNTFLIFAAAIIWVYGVIVSSYAGWTELRLSEVPFLLVGSNAGTPSAANISKLSERRDSVRVQDESISEDAKLNLLTRAQHGLWLEADQPSLSNWDGQSDFAQWLLSRQ